MRRYHDLRAFYEMPFFDGYELLKTAIDYENEQKIYIRWVVGYQSTTTYLDFKNKLMKKSVKDERSADEILDAVRDLMGRFGAKNGI